MPLLARTVNTPLLIEVRRGAVADLGPLLADRRISAGGDVAVVVGPGQGERIAELIRPTLGSADVFTVAGGTLDAALELGEKLRARSYDAVVGIGGGKTIDTAKYAATRYGIPMVSVATSLANDGIASPIATPRPRRVERASYGVHIPIAVMVDLDFVENGPDRQNRAGIGDAAQQPQRARRLGAGPRGTRRAGRRAGRHAGPDRRRGAASTIPGDMTDDGFVTILAEALIPGGLAMAVCGTSRPCSGGCHEISHAIDTCSPGTGSHGEQVGLGALFCTFLRGDLDAVRGRWRPACAGTGCRACRPTSA